MHYLLERLANPPPAGAGQCGMVDLRPLVGAQIQRIVSTHTLASRNGTSLLETGLPHVVEQGVQEQLALQRYATQLTLLILRHEPRLLQPRTTIVATGLALTPYQLLVTGSLAPGADPEQFCFELPLP
ncbi:hypothetical protein [Herbaspirillum rubrisubalbicans]|uniref:Type VI secretion system baseplate subunit TssE n=1 Tax=Herbaspirillum rubrisubalbicans TaxID=80842 RepID=A0AAD0XHA2_9BURK|nr:hypothetical protein [Herbaspirillum rubrisubalbicans]ALU89495.1 hypothetical protein Hrubri_2310 [Herbaspirillum rubrisubalbicans M1]AYR24574.1 type VI secretion system baseplate subunit TssE [Herbaspirillum rubrisubalbicans]